MANPPRKPGSRRPQDRPEPMDDLFAEDDEPLEAQATAPSSPADDWDIELDAPAPSRARTALPAEPIPLASSDFESNPAAAPSPAPLSTSSAAIPAGQAPPVPSASPPSPAPVSDPFQIDDDLPLPAPRAREYKPTPEPELPVLPPEDFTPSTTASGEAPALRRHTGGLLLAAVVLLGLFSVFAGVLYSNRPISAQATVNARPTLPMSGQLVTISELSTSWRTRQPGDIVSTVDITLPAPGRAQPAYLPEVKFTLDSGTSKSGFIRFIFLDPDGKISGDVRVLKINGSSINPMASGAIVSGSSATIYGSLGFMDRPGYIAYATGGTTRWAVEVSESSDYNAKEAGWNKLDTFELRNSTSD